MLLDLHQRFRAGKVAEIDVQFWVIKILTTAMGEATSDFLVHRFQPELAVLATAVVFVAVLLWQLRATRFSTLTYWSAVVMVGVFGTMAADVTHVGLGVPYVVSTSVFALALAATFRLWHRTEGTLSIHSIVTTRRELFYWATVVFTFALGTAAGDMTATTLRLGYLTSGLLFAALIVVPGLLFRYAHASPVGTFWCSYVLTRPLGASFADYLGVSHARGGLAWGPGNVALLFSALIVVGVTRAAWRSAPRGAHRQ